MYQVERFKGRGKKPWKSPKGRENKKKISPSFHDVKQSLGQEGKEFKNQTRAPWVRFGTENKTQGTDLASHKSHKQLKDRNQ